MTPNQILDSIDFQSEEDSKLLYAVIAYCHASAIEEKRFDGPYNAYNLGSIISKCVTNLLDRSEHKIENGAYIAVINQAAISILELKGIESSLEKFLAQRGLGG